MNKPVNKYGVKVGDIFHSQFGYNMILHNFYQVTAIEGNTKIALQELKTRVTNHDGYGQVGHLVVCPNEFEDRANPIHRMTKICPWNNKVEIKIGTYERAELMTMDEWNEEFYFDYMD